ncbi:MAG: ribulose 1,5-bisphosphate carboxylase large subunit [Deltaproteobacteria bacterium]|nr:ribulose 1,5-bisphosphate carboxylase large subunit [Deltaproteobacteria bacterium]
MEYRLGGERLRVVYRIAARDEAEARVRAEDVCIEQTVEFPEDLVRDPDIRRGIFGQLEALAPAGSSERAALGWDATIGYAVEIVGRELTQLLNVIFGNVSLKPGIRVEQLELPPGLLALFPGPRFGRAGLRALLAAPARPLLCSALKPLGLTAGQLAALAGQLALGGLDLIKDDHGLADQPFAPFRERVARCAAAVAEANARTGGRCRYLPNVSAPAGELGERALLARELGAGGLLVSPGLVGLDALRRLADDDGPGLPILAHPALLGSYVVHPDSGIAHRVLFGLLLRLAGADGVVFPHAGGRFSFSLEACRSLAAGTAEAMGRLRPAFPAPAGGMRLERVAELRAFYDDEAIFLIGGDLHRCADLVAACRRFRELVEEELPTVVRCR